jgi:hypothetical protein
MTGILAWSIFMGMRRYWIFSAIWGDLIGDKRYQFYKEFHSRVKLLMNKSSKCVEISTPPNVITKNRKNIGKFNPEK